MSSYPITGCGLPSKPRANQPSMFEILSWVGDDQLSESHFQQPQQKVTQQVVCHSTQINSLAKINEGTQTNVKTIQNNQKITQSNPARILPEQVYKLHRSPQKANQAQHQHQTIPQIVIDQNQQKVFTKSRLYKKEIKHELNSYEPANLKASRAKSATIIPKTDTQQKVNTIKQEIQLDQKTIKERKQKIKEFQVFTRILPNSAFTTYYGKPAFQNYGRGTSCRNLKSFNVMPHKGDNHPHNIESHYTALIKARNVKSKSYMPRKPIEQTLPVPSHNQENLQIQVPQLPLQKPDLIKSKRFATIIPQTGKKAGPPQTSKRSKQSVKKTTTNAPQSRQVKSKSCKQPLGDGLKYLNKRQNLIDILEEKKLKASQLAYKVTQCYPDELEVQNLQKSAVTKQNWEWPKPAGKPSNKGDPVSDLIQSRFFLKQNNTQA